MSVARLVFDRDERRRRKTRKAIIDAVRDHFATMPNLAGFALTTWESDMTAKSSWTTNGTIPGSLVADFVRTDMIRTLAIDDARDLLDDPPKDDPA